MKMIEVNNLKKSFGKLEVLKDINIDVHPQEVVCVIGPSGSGKSTLLRCMNLLEEPTGGEIFIEGDNLTAPKTNINELRQRLGMVFQHFNLFPHMTVMENVTRLCQAFLGTLFTSVFQALYFCTLFRLPTARMASLGSPSF